MDQLVTEAFDTTTNVWTLNILNTEAGLQEALKRLKLAAKENKLKLIEEESKAKKQEYLQELLDFLSLYYTSSHGHTEASNLRQHFLSHLHITSESMNEKRFGTLMSIIIKNPEYNILNIARKSLRNCVAYSGIKLSRAPAPSLVKLPLVPNMPIAHIPLNLIPLPLSEL